LAGGRALEKQPPAQEGGDAQGSRDDEAGKETHFLGAAVVLGAERRAGEQMGTGRRVSGNLLCLFKRKHTQSWVKVLFGQQLS